MQKNLKKLSILFFTQLHHWSLTQRQMNSVQNHPPCFFKIDLMLFSRLCWISQTVSFLQVSKPKILYIWRRAKYSLISSLALCLWIDGHKTSGSKQGAHSHHSAKAHDVNKGYKTGGGHTAEGGHNDEKGHKGHEGHKSTHNHYYGQKGDTGKEKHVKKSEEKGGNTKSHHDEGTHGAGHDEHESGGHGTEHKGHDKYKKTGFTKVRYTHSILCLTSSPYPLSKRVLLRVRSSVSYYNFHYPLSFLRSSNKRLQFLPLVTVTLILLSSFPSTACFRRQILRKLWSFKWAFLLLLYVGYSFPPWLNVLVILLHFSHHTTYVQLIFSILL